MIAARLKIWPLALAILTSFGCGPKQGGQTKAIRLATTQGGLVSFPVYLAESLGFWRDERLEVTILDLAGGSKAMEALLSGSADVVSGFYEHAIQIAAEGRAIRTFVRRAHLGQTGAPAGCTIRKLYQWQGPNSQFSVTRDSSRQAS
jgi:ABC-type nitrate/sulfonate/bicarbonate transport system substrate-binding protein